MIAPATRRTDAGAAHALRDWLAPYRRVFVLSGAGCSTASGIGDYRDAQGAWKRPRPITLQAFTGDPAMYRRYWARSYLGWPHFAAAQPNATHHALARWEHGAGRMAMLLTQNVDRLHQRAGSQRVIDLHGRLDQVRCLGCGDRMPRAALQARLQADNPGWRAQVAAYAPDGDADIDAHASDRFQPPYCTHCGGLLKPDVVFFGENVPRDRFVTARDALLAADAMLVVGSSLMVYSGFRFARMAHEAGLPLAIVNRGLTRADALATLKLESEVGAAFAFVDTPAGPDARGTPMQRSQQA